jgi:hypothetical protein
MEFDSWAGKGLSFNFWKRNPGCAAVSLPDANNLRGSGRQAFPGPKLLKFGVWILFFFF